MCLSIFRSIIIHNLKIQKKMTTKQEQNEQIKYTRKEMDNNLVWFWFDMDYKPFIELLYDFKKT